MCEPITLASLAVAAGGAAYQASQASELNSKQEQANNEWMAYQRKIREDENARQEEMRKKAEVARTGQLDTLTPDAQTTTQTVESDRLYGDMAAGTPTTAANIGDRLLSGQAQGGQNFQEDVASKVSNASKAARDRIRALADIQSYGNSFNGLGTSNKINFGNSDAALGLVNNWRNGSLRSYGLEQSVEPVRYTAGSNLAGQIAGMAASVAGSRIGASFGSGGGGVTPISSSTGYGPGFTY